MHTFPQTDAVVCIVGKDLDLKKTSIGTAFLAKCPELQQVFSKVSLSKFLNTTGILQRTNSVK
jgi:DNA-binding IclR family transcriptional regulator